MVDGDDGEDQTPDTVTPTTARHHLELLKRSYQRLGGWDKKASVYKELVDQLIHMPQFQGSEAFKGVKGTEKWDHSEKADHLGEFSRPVDWEFVIPGYLTDKGTVSPKYSQGATRHGMGLRRVTGNWGMSGLYHDLTTGVFKFLNDCKDCEDSEKLNGSNNRDNNNKR